MRTSRRKSPLHTSYMPTLSAPRPAENNAGPNHRFLGGYNIAGRSSKMAARFATDSAQNVAQGMAALLTGAAVQGLGICGAGNQNDYVLV